MKKLYCEPCIIFVKVSNKDIITKSQGFDPEWLNKDNIESPFEGNVQ